jgi:hypothetical protein
LSAAPGTGFASGAAAIGFSLFSVRALAGAFLGGTTFLLTIFFDFSCGGAFSGQPSASASPQQSKTHIQRILAGFSMTV